MDFLCSKKILLNIANILLNIYMLCIEKHFNTIAILKQQQQQQIVVAVPLEANICNLNEIFYKYYCLFL